MLAVSGGRLICLSTPYGKRGFFYKAWAKGGDEWKRIEIPATSIKRIAPAFLEEERRNLGESWFRQEYCCSFEALEGLVYPDFKRCVTALLPSPGTPGEGSGVRAERLRPQSSPNPHPNPSPGVPGEGPQGRPVGGIDFGFPTPFAAVSD